MNTSSDDAPSPCRMTTSGTFSVGTSPDGTWTTARSRLLAVVVGAALGIALTGVVRAGLALAGAAVVSVATVFGGCLAGSFVGVALRPHAESKRTATTDSRSTATLALGGAGAPNIQGSR